MFWARNVLRALADSWYGSDVRDEHRPARGPQQSAADQQQRALAAAAGSLNGDRFLGFDRQGNPVDRLHLPLLAGIGLGDVLKSQHPHASLRISAGSR